MNTDDGFPLDWTQPRYREELLKWIDAMSRLLESSPGGLFLWQQTRDYQSLITRLAVCLEFVNQPFARREEKFEIEGPRGPEYHEREWLVASDPAGETTEEYFYTWIRCPEAKTATFQNRKAGFDDAFRAQVLDYLKRWKAAVGSGT